MGFKEDAMWKMAKKMGMPESAIEAVKARQKAGGKSAMPDFAKMAAMMKAMGGKDQDAMRKMAEKMGMPPLAKGMDGNELLGRLNRLSKIESIKDVPQLTRALFPGTHCPLMGAAMVAGGIKDCLLVIVGTDECSYYTKSLTISDAFGGIGGRCVSVVLDTHDVTFGSAAKMHAAFKEIVEEYAPKCVMLVTTCVVEVIGDDYDAISAELSRQYGIPVLPVHTEHFKCEDHFPGLERGITVCMDIMEETPANGKVNVLGQRMGNFSDTELYAVLKDAGVEIGVQLPSGCTVDEIRCAPGAKANIVVNDIALPLAQAMEEKYGIHYVYFNRFATPENILGAYKQLFEYLGFQLPESVGEKYRAAKEKEQAAKKLLFGKTYIYGNTTYDCFEINSYMCSLGMVPQIIQTNKFREDHLPDIAKILKTCDPYVCKAANIAPLQYIYDILHPWLYLGHEFADKLRRKGIAIVHLDAVSKTLGFDSNTLLLDVLEQSACEAAKYREEAGL